MIVDFRPEIRIATSWDETELQHPSNALQLHGYSYSDEEVTLEFNYLTKLPQIGKQMLFEIKGELFYCDQIEWTDCGDASEIKGRVVSRC